MSRRARLQKCRRFLAGLAAVSCPEPCPALAPRPAARGGPGGAGGTGTHRAPETGAGALRAEPPGSLPAARSVPRLDLLTVLDLFVIAFAAVVLLHSLPQKRNNSQGYQTTTSRSTTMQEPQPATAPGMPYGPPQQIPGTYQGAGNYGFQAQPTGFPGGFGVPPVQNQPNMNGAIWMPIPPSIPNCPPGLEYLTQIDQILIQQQLELLEIVTGFETSNKYELKNALGQRVYFAAEDTDCLTRNFCGSARPFTLRIIDNLGHEVITLHRPLRCSSCCCPCCLQELEVQAPPGTTVGYVVQNWHAYLPKFTIQDEKRTDILKIIGPCIVCRCCEDVNFEVMSVDETSAVGRISKKWTGFVQEAFTDTDTFGISFPMDLDVKMKAVMIGACFLIDFMFFEYSGN